MHSTSASMLERVGSWKDRAKGVSARYQLRERTHKKSRTFGESWRLQVSNLGLNNLKRRNGIDDKALGRGIGSGCGKTSSYGHKGGKARSGRGKPTWFEGGQMPIYRRLPKRGFVSMHDKSCISCVNLVTLQRLCDNNVLTANQDVNIETLKAANVVRSSACTVRLLGKGELKTALNISVAYASVNAIRAVEAIGGKVVVG